MGENDQLGGPHRGDIHFALTVVRESHLVTCWMDISHLNAFRYGHLSTKRDQQPMIAAQ
jgi:hypothetical protein